MFFPFAWLIFSAVAALYLTACYATMRLLPPREAYRNLRIFRKWGSNSPMTQKRLEGVAMTLLVMLALPLFFSTRVVLAYAWVIVAICGALYIAVCRPRHQVLTFRAALLTLENRFDTRTSAPKMWKEFCQAVLGFLILLCLPLYIHIPGSGRIGCAVWAGLFLHWSWVAAHFYRPRYLTSVACALYAFSFLSLALDPTLIDWSLAVIAIVGLAMIRLDKRLVALARQRDKART